MDSHLELGSVLDLAEEFRIGVPNGEELWSWPDMPKKALALAVYRWLDARPTHLSGFGNR